MNEIRKQAQAFIIAGNKLIEAGKRLNEAYDIISKYSIDLPSEKIKKSKNISKTKTKKSKVKEEVSGLSDLVSELKKANESVREISRKLE